MREILFRGKTTLGNEWTIGAGVYKSEGYTWIITDDVTKTENRGTGSDAIIPETIGQYAGLTDKNHVKIFEGDIVKAKQGKHKDVATVGFENGSFMVYPIFAKIYERNIWEYWYNDWDLEVIGNIFDNPELMKGGGSDDRCE